MIEIGKGALAEPADGEMLLGLSRLAEILEGSQGPQRGVEEGEEVGDEDVVEEELAIPVRILLVELIDETSEGTNMLGPKDLLGPDRQIAFGQDRRSRELGSLGRWDRVRESRFGGHNRIP